MWHGVAGVFQSTSHRPANIAQMRPFTHQTVDIPDSSVRLPTDSTGQIVGELEKHQLNHSLTLLAQGLLYCNCAIFNPLEENMNTLHSLSPQIQYEIAVAILVVGLAFGLAAKFLS